MALRALAHAALESDGLTVHVLKIGAAKLNDHAADLLLDVAVVASRRHVDVGLERLGISILEVLERGSPGKRAHDVDVDAIGTPLVGGDASQAADALLGSGVAALAEVAKQAGTRGKVDNGALGLLQVRIGLLHIQVSGIQAGVNGQVELVHGVIGDRHARSAGLGVVDDGVDAAELGDSLVDNVLNDSLIVLTSRNIGLNGQDLNAVLGLERLLGGLELGNVAAGDDEVCALLGKSDIDAVTDGTSGAVLERGFAATRDDHGLTSEKSHTKSFQNRDGRTRRLRASK